MSEIPRCNGTGIHPETCVSGSSIQFHLAQIFVAGRVFLIPPGKPEFNKLSVKIAPSGSNRKGTAHILLSLESSGKARRISSLPIEENENIENPLSLLGLNTGSSVDDIHQSAAIFAKVWEPRHYRRSRRLLKRAERKLAELEQGVELLLKTVIP